MIKNKGHLAFETNNFIWKTIIHSTVFIFGDNGNLKENQNRVFDYYIIQISKIMKHQSERKLIPSYLWHLCLNYKTCLPVHQIYNKTQNLKFNEQNTVEETVNCHMGLMYYLLYKLCQIVVKTTI